MASAVASRIEPDAVVSFEINPGTLPRLLESRAEGGPRLKCVEGRVTLVSPGRPHESMGHRLDRLIMLVCLELGIDHEPLGSTTWVLPTAERGTAYEADEAYYIQSCGAEDPDRPPDLAVEVVVSHPETKALWAGALLKIPELWVLDVPRRGLTFYHLTAQGEERVYRPEPTSLAFPFLTPDEVFARLDDAPTHEATFLRNCRTWARRVLLPRFRRLGEGG